MIRKNKHEQYYRWTVEVPKSKKEMYKDAAKQRNMSLNKLTVAALNEYLDKR